MGFNYLSSSIDWCENNFVYSSYVAEFWNTLSSVILTLLGLLGMYHTNKIKCNIKYKILYAFLTLVGVGSILFHSTLSKFGHVVDELAIILCLLYHISFKSQKSFIISSLLFIIIMFGWHLHFMFTPYIIHTLGFIDIYLYYNYFKIRCEYMPQIKYIFSISIILFASSVVCWVLDNFCFSYIQFHAIWHMLSGLSIYLAILCELYVETQYSVIKYSYGVPYIYILNEQEKSMYHLRKDMRDLLRKKKK